MALQDSATAARVRTIESAVGLDVTVNMITVTPDTGCAAPGTTTDLASVTIEYPFGLISGLLPIDDFTLTGKGTMRCFG